MVPCVSAARLRDAQTGQKAAGLTEEMREDHRLAVSRRERVHEPQPHGNQHARYKSRRIVEQLTEALRQQSLELELQGEHRLEEPHHATTPRPGRSSELNRAALMTVVPSYPGGCDYPQWQYAKQLFPFGRISTTQHVAAPLPWRRTLRASAAASRSRLRSPRLARPWDRHRLPRPGCRNRPRAEASSWSRSAPHSSARLGGSRAARPHLWPQVGQRWRSAA